MLYCTAVGRLLDGGSVQPVAMLERRPGVTAAPANDEAPLNGEAQVMVVQREIAAAWRLLLPLFVVFRLLGLLFLRSGGFLYSGGFDFLQYRRWGELSLEGHYPFLHYWVEYPPIFPWVAIGIYRLSLLLPPPSMDLFWFQMMLGVFLLLFETGTLLLVYQLSNDLWGMSRGFRSALIYAGLFAPLFTILNWFDSFPLFFLLLATWLAVRRRAWLAGAAVGIGFMVKLIPLVAAPASLQYLAARDRLRYALAATMAILAVASPFLLSDARWLVAGFQATMARSSWETIWALMEGYFGYGAVAPFSERSQPASALWASHPATLPWPLINAAFLSSCLLVFLRRPPVPAPRAMVAGVGLTLNLFLLFSKGFSPQFLVYPLALLAVLMPNGWGVAYATLLTLDSFVEFPLATMYFSEERWLLWATVVARTLILCFLSVEFAVLLFRKGSETWFHWRRQLALPVFCLLVVGAAFATGRLVDRAFSASGEPAAVVYMRSLSAPGEGLVASDRAIFYRLKPYFGDQPFLLAEGDAEQTEEELQRRLASFSSGRSQVWLLLDHGSSDGRSIRDWLASWYDRWGSRATDVWFGPWQLLGYLPYAADSATPITLNAEFGGQLTLAGYELFETGLAPGRRFRLGLLWRAERVPDKDYKVFVHLLDQSGRKAAQSDAPLSFAGAGSATWSAGAVVRQGYDLTVPADASPGEYVLIAGLYDPKTGQRLPVASDSRRQDESCLIQAIVINRMPSQQRGW